ncbi:glucosaminidase domain-containing protein [Alicyclobacillus sp. SO9]|uniref:glucosaminidase domain-containing protein n=1 Tax=Alicyclobacillus sp. SO9 TaxID=2665646 RepID=UPI0018E7167F|nr:glucosaminidase domain-containing protein [Alicyclobacillus sp. SO9]QQE78789.1 glucosaminidase domain-containing protein [Alicyclobacillus sp. SO9]
MAISTSNIYLYAATAGDFRMAQAAARLAGVSSGNVIGSFAVAYSLVQVSSQNFVLAVGGAALYALYYNPCGWGGFSAGSTPFSYYTSAQCSALPTNMFINAAGTTAADTFYRVMALTYYAINCAYPNEFPSSSMPAGLTPQNSCKGNSDQSCPCPSGGTGGGCSFPSSPPTACSSNQTTFINNYLSYAKTASNKTGLPVSFILGHWGLETAWGTSAGLPSCNNPGNLVVSGQPTCSACGGCGVSSFSTLTNGVNAYISAMNNKYPFVKWAYDNYGLKEACKAIGAGCEPGSGYTANIYATGRYNGVYCVVNGSDEAVSNNCYMTSTTAGNGQTYYSCSQNSAGYDEGVTQSSCVSSCNGCGWVGCSLYSTVTSSCLSPYDCVS